MKLPVEVSNDAARETDQVDEILLLLPNVADPLGGMKPTSWRRLCRERLLPNAVLNDEQVSDSARNEYKLKAKVTAVFIVNHKFVIYNACGRCEVREKCRRELFLRWVC